MWFRSGTVTSGEAHPQALCVSQCPCPPQPQWVAGTWHQHYPPLPHSLAEHLLSRQPPPPPQPPPFNPQSGVTGQGQGQGHGAFQPDTDARWPDWPVHTAPPVALGPQPESHADSWRRRGEEEDEEEDAGHKQPKERTSGVKVDRFNRAAECQ